MTRAKRNPSFKEWVTWKIEVIHQILVDLIRKEDRKEFKRSWKEPVTWKLDKISDGKWQFDWDNGSKGHGQASGDFNFCIESMKRLEGIYLDNTDEKVDEKKDKVVTLKEEVKKE